MNILAVTESPSWVEHHIVGSLTDMGHDVMTYPTGTFVGEYYSRSRWQERKHKNQQLVELARRLRSEERLDLIFCYVYDDFLTVEHASSLAAIGVPTVNLNVDMTNQWYRQSRTARYFTAILCAQTTNMESLAQYGAKVRYFPMAARQSDIDRAEGINFAPAAPVTFLGTPTHYRLRVLSYLEGAGVPLAVYGRHWSENRQASPERSIGKTLSDIHHYAWPRLKAEGPGGLARAIRDRAGGLKPGALAPPVLERTKKEGFLPDKDVFALFRGSAINVGFTRMVGEDPEKPGRNQVKLRDFEVPLAGGFYLVEDAPDYDRLFRRGKEVETWRTPAELLEKVRYYLAHEEPRATIAAAGAKRARGEHTWVHRFDALFASLGLG
jgi:hypothetical protein